METSKQILIVCTGNICRSPMAVGLLRSMLHHVTPTKPVVVSSAGTRALVGQPASPNAVTAMAERDIDISHHSARQLRQPAIVSADLILVMDERHRESVLDLAGPDALFKTLLFAELVGKHSPIRDPYGMPLNAYRDCAAELEQILADGLHGLLRYLAPNQHRFPKQLHTSQ